MKEEKVKENSGGELASEPTVSDWIDVEEEFISPAPDDETTDKFVDENRTHIIVPGDFSTTYIPIKKDVEEATTKSGKTK